MTDGQLLFLVMALIYVFECFVWLPKGAFVCLRGAGSRRRLRTAPSNFSSRKGGWILASPFPPLGTVFVTRPSPVALSQDGIAAFMIESPNPGFRPESVVGPVFRWEEIERITRDGKKIYINGEFFVISSTPEASQELLSQLRCLKDVAKEKREAIIKRQLRLAFNTRRVGKLIKFWERKSAALRGFCNLLLFLLFGGIPACLIFYGASLELLACGIASLVTMFLISLIFFRLHKRLYPDVVFERWQWFFLILLVPQQTVRAHDLLLKAAVAAAHPLAVGDFALPVDSEQRRNFMGSLYRDLMFPLQWKSKVSGSTGAIISEFYDQYLLPELSRFAGSHEVELSSWKIPEREEEESQSFCPRCFEMFSTSELKDCHDCEGIVTLAWEADQANPS